MAEYASMGVTLPRTAVGKAVKELVVIPEPASAPLAPTDKAAQLIKGILVGIGSLLAVVVVLRILGPIIEQLLGAIF